MTNCSGEQWREDGDQSQCRHNIEEGNETSHGIDNLLYGL